MNRIVMHEEDNLCRPVVRMTGYYTTKKTLFRMAPHVHENIYELCYFSKGCVEWWAGDRCYSIRSGEVYVTPPNELHGSVDGVFLPSTCHWIQINPAKLKLFKTGSPALHSHLRNGLAALVHRKFKGSPHLESLFHHLMDLHEQRSACARERAELTVMEIVAEIIRLHDLHREEPVGKVSRKIAKARKLMHENFTEPLSVEKLARGLSMSPSGFREAFRREIGVAPIDYLKRYRINRAKEMLMQGEKRLTRIAQDCGFANSQYFSTAFKKMTGVAPKNFCQQAEASGNTLPL